MRELVLPGRFNLVSTSFTVRDVMVFGRSQQETLDRGFALLGTRHQGVSVILRELVLPGRFNLVSTSFTVRDVTTELSEPRSTSCRTEM
ncbi:unnamed protein product [Schistosoma mattheei]|uniref:Uncharacterized protein n=1 Tax=Schistosoma mattheei TaxID=31246 RepID=A0A3P8FNL9_9TREM|nr:unnamed protein product [Schistosoma mattheei]